MISFAGINQRPNLTRRLQNSIVSQKVNHAYIFEGEEGMGKLDTARAFAKALQCESNSGGDACCACLSCLLFESGNHPDILYVEATKTKSIGVDDVRQQMVLPMSEKTFRFRYKIFIIDKAETLTSAAQNAMLKTIEEPASFGVFLFLAAHTRNFLPTVLSRCIVIKLNPIPDNEVIKFLMSKGIPEKTCVSCAEFAKGNPGRALNLAESAEFNEMRTLALSVVERAQKMEQTDIFSLYSQFDKWRESIQELLDILYMCMRDLLIKTTSVKSKAKNREALKTSLNGLDAVTEAKRSLQRNGNFQLSIELMLFKICSVQKLYTPEQKV